MAGPVLEAEMYAGNYPQRQAVLRQMAAYLQAMQAAQQEREATQRAQSVAGGAAQQMLSGMTPIAGMAQPPGPQPMPPGGASQPQAPQIPAGMIPPPQRAPFAANAPSFGAPGGAPPGGQMQRPIPMGQGQPPAPAPAPQAPPGLRAQPGGPLAASMGTDTKMPAIEPGKMPTIWDMAKNIRDLNPNISGRDFYMALEAAQPMLEAAYRQESMLMRERLDQDRLKLDELKTIVQGMKVEQTAGTGGGGGTPTSFMKEAETLYGKGTPEYNKAIEKHLARMDAPTRVHVGGSGSATASTILDKDTIRMMAEQYLAGDKSVASGLGYGNVGATNRAALRKGINELAKERGMSGKDIAAAIAEFSGIVAGERTAGQRSANIEMAVSEASKMAKLVVDASNKFDRTEFPPLNKALAAYERGTGGVEVRRLGAAINSFINAYARAVAPAGVPTVSDKDHARDMIELADTQEAVVGIIDQLQMEMRAAQEAPPEVRQQLREAVTGKKRDTTEAPKAPEKKRVRWDDLPAQ